MPRTRSEFARAFSDIIQANWYPDEIQAMAHWARELERTYSIEDIQRAHNGAPYDWGVTDWEDE